MHTQVEESSTCRFDYVIVRDGSDSKGGNLIGKFCGSRTPKKILSPGNKLWIEFFSDGSVTKKGFTATYKAIGMHYMGVFCALIKINPLKLLSIILQNCS